MLKYPSSILDITFRPPEEIEYGVKLEELLTKQANLVFEDYINKPITNTIINQVKKLAEYKISQLYPFFLPVKWTYYNESHNSLMLSSYILEYAQGWVLLNPQKEKTHKWVHTPNFNNGSLAFPSSKCSDCGLQRMLKDGWTFAQQDLTCDEIIIKDIIE